MRFFLFLLSFFLFVFGQTKLYGQSILVKGSLTDSKKNPIVYANIYLENNTEIGTLSDFDGNYELNIKAVDLEEDNYLLFTSIGFKTKRVKIEKVESFRLDVILDEEAEILEEIILSSDSNASKEYTVLKLNKIDIYSNPSASADPLKALQIYPYSTSTDETANPSFRGSNPDKSRVLLNGVPIFNPVRNNQINGLGNFSLFNTEIIDKQLVFPSNPPLIYGNSSAGIVEIETSKSVSNSSQISASISNVGFLINRGLENNNFIQAYGNKQFSDIFLDINKNSLDFLNKFNSFDAGLNFRISNKDNSYFNVFSYLINESYEGNTSLLNTIALNKSSRTRFFSVVNYSKVFENFKITFNNGYDYSKSPLSFANINLTSRDESIYSSINFSFSLNNFFIKSGLSYNFLNRNFNGVYPNFNFAFNEQSPTSNINDFIKTNILEGYFYSKFKFTDFIFSIGLRKNIPINNKNNNIKYQDDYFSYQSFARWNINKENNIILSLGKYHSYNNPNIINRRSNLNSSFQTSLDYTYQKKTTQIKASIYSKKEKGVINNSFDVINNTIDDRTIYGFEFQIEKQLFKNFKFNASYAYLNSRLKFDGESFRASNDLNYFIKNTISYYKSGWNISLSSAYRPGTYYTPVVSTSFNNEAFAYEPTYRNNLNFEQLDNYFRVDFSVNKSFEIGQNRAITFFSVNNIFDKKNERNIVYNTNYSLVNSEFFPQNIFYFGTVFLF